MRIILMTVALPLLAACQSVPSNAPRATASLQPTKGSQTSGKVTFVEAGARVRVNAVVVGLKPGSEHGFHVHEAGDCSSGDGMSTKGISIRTASRMRTSAPPNGTSATCHR